MKYFFGLLFGNLMGYLVMSFVNFTFDASLWPQKDRIMSLVVAGFFVVITIVKLELMEHE